jgi:hypothetical protein
VLIAVAVVVALLAPIVSPLAGADLWGWLPDHGHATTSLSTMPHEHPWQATHNGATAGGSSNVVFTAGDLLGAPAVPVALVVILVLPMLMQQATRASVPARVDAPRGAPEPPPPR